MKYLKQTLALLTLCFAAKVLGAPLLYGLHEANLFCSKAVVKNGNFTYTKHTVVHHDDDYLILGMVVRPNSEITMVSQLDGQSKTVKIEGNIVGFTTNEEAIYALTQDQVLKIKKSDLSLENQSPTIDNVGNLSRYTYATGISTHAKSLYISHGTLGLVLRRADNLKQISHTQLPLGDSRGHRSTLSDVDVNQDKILLGVDNITGSSDGSRGIEGYYLIETNDLANAHFTSINSRREALDFPQVFLEEDSFFALNWFYLFKYKLSDLSARGDIEPIGRYWNMEGSGNFIGRLSLDKDYVYSCSKTKDGKGFFSAISRETYNF